MSKRKQTAAKLAALALAHADTLPQRKKARDLKRSRAKTAVVHVTIPARDTRYSRPALTDQTALELVKLIHSGIPGVLCLSYIAPQFYDTQTDKQRATWLADWQRHPLMAKAAAHFNKAEWQDLDGDARLHIALDKHLAELAYYLYTSDFALLEGLAYKKLADAREALMTHLDASESGDETPFMKAMRDLLADKIGAAGPPQLPMDVAIPIEKTGKKH